MYSQQLVKGLSPYYQSQQVVCSPHSAVQLTPGELNIQLWQLSDEQVQLSRQISDRSLYLEPASATGKVRLLMPSGNPKDNAANWCGIATASDTLLVMPDLPGFYASPEGWDDLDLTISNELALSLGIDPSTPHTLSHPDIAGFERNLRALLESPAEQAKRGTGWMDQVLENLRNCVQQARPSKVLKATTRQQLVERALDYVRDYQLEYPDMTVEHLSAQVGATSRTLQRAFNQTLGVSPYYFLLYVRLNAAHDLLQQHTRESLSVTQVGADCGFASSSNFIDHYSRFYGKTPLQTLRT
ncbi:helix-turn-helix domain-containing protein [Paraferrimonas sedimenticola]|uniref:HTH araC/xylS-type domain-containing protein n=1 Tax=Paraferrimonas sedimenticola TaxID=375674 RepID=A0AA37W0X5_9GAMM|nr:helix-turn-helix domain-containing protein [Paraferrimonas sedimenticola]GLP96223.1 hypothetical protein GCM10007895_15290 [Paraferrimonas sedimenticola]